MAIYVRTPSEILTEAYNRVLAETPIKNLTPGSTARAILEVVSIAQGKQYSEVAFNLAQAYISTAVAEHLDMLGAMLGVYRGSTKVAFDDTYSNFRFKIDPATGLTAAAVASNINAWLTRNGLTSAIVTADSFTIPAGVTIQPGYVTTADAVFASTDTYAFVPVVATSTGTGMNVSPGALNSHNIVSLYQEFSPVASIILCENLLPITNGTNIESDKDYRYRIVNRALSSANANETAIRLAALSVPGVADVLVKKFSRGVGTLDVFVLGVDPIVNTGVLGAVEEVVEKVAAAGIRVSVSRPVLRSLQLTISPTWSPLVSDATKNAIREQIKLLVVNDVNSIEIGGAFIVNAVIRDILGASSSIIDAVITNMVVGEYDPDKMKILRKSPVFVTNQTLYWDEKFFTSGAMVTVC